MLAKTANVILLTPLRLIPDYPSPLMSVLPAPSGDALFESEDEGILLCMSHEHGSSDRQIIQLFDLHAVKREITPMQTCARETGTLRESGGRPVGSDLKGEADTTRIRFHQ
jgi:hypothetical protein